MLDSLAIIKLQLIILYLWAYILKYWIILVKYSIFFFCLTVGVLWFTSI